MKRLIVLVVVVLCLGSAQSATGTHSNGKPHKSGDQSLVNKLQAGNSVTIWAPYYLPPYSGRYYWEERSGWNSFGTTQGSEPSTPYVKFSTNCGPVTCPAGKDGLAYTWPLYPNVFFIWISSSHYNSGELAAHEVGHHVVPTYCSGTFPCHGVYPYKGVMRDPVLVPFSTIGKGDDHWICKYQSLWCN